MSIAVSIIACGGTSKPSASTGATVPSNAAPTEGNATPTESSADTPVDLCAALTSAQIGAATGGTYAEGIPGDTRCAWNLASNTGNVTIDPGAPIVAALAVGSESIAGLGDQAVCTCGKRLAVLGVVTGTTGFIVQVSGVDDSAAGAKAVAELVLDALTTP